MISTAFSKGRVSEFMPTRNWISLADGWIAKLIFGGEVRDMYLKVCHGDSLLPLHSHPQRQHVYIVSGSLKMCIDDTERMLHEGEGVIVPANTPHSMRGDTRGDTIVFVVYEPPMMH